MSHKFCTKNQIVTVSAHLFRDSTGISVEIFKQKRRTGFLFSLRQAQRRENVVLVAFVWHLGRYGSCLRAVCGKLASINLPRSISLDALLLFLILLFLDEKSVLSFVTCMYTSQAFSSIHKASYRYPLYNDE